jgi:hypothetical protein
MSPYDGVTQRLQVLREQVASYVGTATQTIGATSEELELRLGRAELSTSRRQLVSSEDNDTFVARVKNELASGATPQVRPADARRVGRLFQKFDRELVQDVLQRQPSGWRPFVDSLFRSRMELRPPDWKRWEGVAAAAPSSIPLLHRPIERSRLLLADAAESARAVADQFRHEASVGRVDAVACAPGLLHRSWPYTSLVLARWSELHRDRWRSNWNDVSGEVLLEAMLLPRRNGERSWFEHEREVPFPLAVPEHIEAQARFLAGCVAAWLEEDAPDDPRFTRLLDILSQSREWRDPRTFSLPRDEPESPGWKAFRAVARETYEALVERLLAEDLDLFFDKIEEFDRRRRKYWKKQLRHILSTTFFFSPETLNQLRREFTGHHPLHQKARNALDRARLLAGGNGVDALCLTFRGGVVVEFSQTGNAAYLYTRERYQRVAPRGREVTMRDLKRPSDAEQRLMHHSDWERKFDADLLTVFRPASGRS